MFNNIKLFLSLILIGCYSALVTVQPLRADEQRDTLAPKSEVKEVAKVLSAVEEGSLQVPALELEAKESAISAPVAVKGNSWVVWGKNERLNVSKNKKFFTGLSLFFIALSIAFFIFDQHVIGVLLLLPSLIFLGIISYYIFYPLIQEKKYRRYVKEHSDSRVFGVFHPLADLSSEENEAIMRDLKAAKYVNEEGKILGTFAILKNKEQMIDADSWRNPGVREKIYKACMKDVEEFLREKMDLVLALHGGNNNFECGWDCLNYYLFQNGIKNAEKKPYPIGLLRYFIEKHAMGTDPENIPSHARDFKQALAVTHTLTSLFEGFVRFLKIPPRPSASIAYDNGHIQREWIKEERDWRVFLNKYSPFVSRVKPAIFMYGIAAMIVIDVDPERGLVIALDPHQKGSGILRRISFKDIKDKMSLEKNPATEKEEKVLRIFPLPLMDESSRERLEKEFEEMHLQDKKPGRETDLFRGAFEFAEKIMRDKNWTHKELYAHLRNDSELKTDPEWQAFKQLMEDFHLHLILLDENNRSVENHQLWQSAQYLLETRPKEYKQHFNSAYNKTLMRYRPEEFAISGPSSLADVLHGEEAEWSVLKDILQEIRNDESTSLMLKDLEDARQSLRFYRASNMETGGKYCSGSGMNLADQFRPLEIHSIALNEALFDSKYWPELRRVVLKELIRAHSHIKGRSLSEEDVMKESYILYMRVFKDADALQLAIDDALSNGLLLNAEEIQALLQKKNMLAQVAEEMKQLNEGWPLEIQEEMEKKNLYDLPRLMQEAAGLAKNQSSDKTELLNALISVLDTVSSAA